jgi:transposase
LQNKNGIVDILGQTLSTFQPRDATMPGSNVTQVLPFSEVKILSQKFQKKTVVLIAVKVSKIEICPKCATPSTSVYDHRKVQIKDEPFSNRRVSVVILKRRFSCKNCYAVFMEPVAGIRKGHRTSERFKRAVVWACETFTSLKKVQLVLDISPSYVFKVFYLQPLV